MTWAWAKTIQMLAVLLHLRRQRLESASSQPPSLLVVPASLIANWKAEITRFAPALSIFIVHPSEEEVPLEDEAGLTAKLADRDLVITTYGMLARLPWLRTRPGILRSSMKPRPSRTPARAKPAP